MCYTQDNQIQTRVSAEVFDPATGAMSLTNVFQYTFAIQDATPPAIVPKSYHEAMMYLEGRRHFLASTSGD